MLTIERSSRQEKEGPEGSDCFTVDEEKHELGLPLSGEIAVERSLELTEMSQKDHLSPHMSRYQLCKHLVNCRWRAIPKSIRPDDLEEECVGALAGSVEHPEHR